MNFVDVSGRAFCTIPAMDFSFFEAVNQVVQEEPNEAIDPETLGLLASIGIEKGKRFAPDARMKKILVEAAAVGNATARANAYRTRLKEAYFYPNSAWCTPFVGGSYEFLDNGVRLLDARSFMFFYATGITPAMAWRMAGAGAAYAAAFVDASGRPFDGGKRYRLHLPRNIPARRFWSLVLYDNQTRSMLQTDQPLPSISSEKRGVVTNPDGSVDVHFGPKPPTGEESNWVQTWPGKGWNVMLRLYGPLQPFFDKTWRPGEIERMNRAAGEGQRRRFQGPKPPSTLQGGANDETEALGRKRSRSALLTRALQRVVRRHAQSTNSAQALIKRKLALYRHGGRRGEAQRRVRHSVARIDIHVHRSPLPPGSRRRTVTRRPEQAKTKPAWPGTLPRGASTRCGGLQWRLIGAHLLELHRPRSQARR